MDRRSQIGRIAHVRKGRPRLRHAQAKLADRSLDRPLRRMARPARLAEEVRLVMAQSVFAGTDDPLCLPKYHRLRIATESTTCRSVFRGQGQLIFHEFSRAKG